jgi:cytochrome c-type biogenesis protein CcsB
MPVDVDFAHASDRLLFAAVLVYAVATLVYAAVFAFGRTSRVAKAIAGEAELRATSEATDGITAAGSISRVLVGAAGLEVGVGGLAPGSMRAGGPVFGDGSTLERLPRPRVEDGGAGTPSSLGNLAVGLTALGWLLHVASVVCRGFAAHRAPWGNMYEFSSMIALIAVTAFLFTAWRYAVRDLGVFVMIPVVAYIGVAGTALYVPAGPLVPALHSYWIVIHVFAATSATGIFLVSAVANVLFLLRDRYERVVVAGGEPGFTRFAKSLPASPNLDTLTYRLAAFAFPIWTFAIIAGAIWAESAWGRYWGWDPKETWSFITWVVFAGYLHARATAGWKGRRAAYLALLGFGCFVFDFYGVNIWISGLHSYAGL